MNYSTMSNNYYKNRGYNGINKNNNVNIKKS